MKKIILIILVTLSLSCDNDILTNSLATSPFQGQWVFEFSESAHVDNAGANINSDGSISFIAFYRPTQQSTTQITIAGEINNDGTIENDTLEITVSLSGNEAGFMTGNFRERNGSGNITCGMFNGTWYARRSDDYIIHHFNFKPSQASPVASISQSRVYERIYDQSSLKVHFLCFL